MRLTLEHQQQEVDAEVAHHTGQRQALRNALAQYSIDDVIRTYNEIDSKQWLNKHDFRLLAQCLHQSQRQRKPSDDPMQRREETEMLVAFGERLVKDLKSGELKPLPVTHIHLLSFFKEVGVLDPGLRFWEWLERQDESYVNPLVYGAAIELLAVAGTSLPRLEQIYVEALTRFPGHFVSYHLSPDAIVPDRDSEVHIPGLPIMLLQGIVTARLLHGDARNAYIGLDTALRLLPYQLPPRFFSVFLEERPLDEAFTVFALACRASVALPKNYLLRILGGLRQIADTKSVVRQSLSIRAQLSALYLHASTAQRPNDNAINTLMISVTQFLRLDCVSSLEPKARKKLVGEVLDLIRHFFALSARLRVKPGLSVFNAIITNLGGFGVSKQIIDVAVSDAAALGISPNEVTRRSMLTAAGLLQDGELVEQYWKDIVRSREETNTAVDGTDWHCLLKAAHGAGCPDLVADQFHKLKQSIPEQLQESIIVGLEDDSRYDLGGPSSVDLDVAGLFSELDHIEADLKVIDTRLDRRPSPQQINHERLPMSILPQQSKFQVSDRDCRGFYDELTTERQPATLDRPEVIDRGKDTKAEDAPSTSQSEATNPLESQRASANSKTPLRHVPLGRLRYENWKTVNWLLERAESNDSAYIKQVDEAIANKTTPPERSLGWLVTNEEELRSYGLSDLDREDRARPVEQTKAARKAELEVWKRHVLQLRGRA